MLKTIGLLSGLQATPRPLGGLQDAPETDFISVAKRYYNYLFIELAGMTHSKHNYDDLLNL